jgi:putative FmdB family regulatory protein
MPIYEYRCNKCGRIFSHLSGVTWEKSEPICPRCGGKDLKKLFSRFARVKSDEEMLENLMDFTSKVGDLDDPKALMKFTKMMSKQFGDELGEDVVEEMEREVERELSGEKEEKESDQIEE